MISWVFFGASVFVTLFTVNAFVPVRKNRLLFVPSFFASWLTIELAWWHLFWEAAGAAALIGLGALERPIGWVGLAVAIVNWVALWVILLRGHVGRQARRGGPRSARRRRGRRRRSAARCGESRT